MDKVFFPEDYNDYMQRMESGSLPTVESIAIHLAQQADRWGIYMLYYLTARQSTVVCDRLKDYEKEELAELLKQGLFAESLRLDVIECLFIDKLFESGNDDLYEMAETLIAIPFSEEYEEKARQYVLYIIANLPVFKQIIVRIYNLFLELLNAESAQNNKERPFIDKSEINKFLFEGYQLMK